MTNVFIDYKRTTNGFEETQTVDTRAGTAHINCFWASGVVECVFFLLIKKNVEQLEFTCVHEMSHLDVCEFDWIRIGFAVYLFFDF